MKRLVIHIDEEKCTGCGLCVPSCAEGALQIVDGKAKLVSETFCDGLGACLGECPEGALLLEEREAEEFDAEAVQEHLDRQQGNEETLPCGCPSSSERVLQRPSAAPAPVVPSELGHWPVQLTLVSPKAPFFDGCDLLIAADCVPFAYPGFHQDLLKGHSLVIGCPKLDDADAYVRKLVTIFSLNNIRSVTVAHMEVPCCFGLVQIVNQALQQSGKALPLQDVTISIDGEIENGVGQARL